MKQQKQQSDAASPVNGKKIAEIMERMAARNALAEIEDPAKWQKEIRKDRVLPGRDD